MRRFSLVIPAFALLVGMAPAIPTGTSAQEPAVSTGADYHLDATWKPGGEGGWDYLTVDPQSHRLYVTRPDRVQVIDTENGKLLGEVPGLDGGHGVALVPELHRGFVTSGRNNMVLAFDLQTLQLVGEPIHVGKKPDAIVYDGLSRHVFVFDGESNDATVIDAATARVVATISLGGAPEFAVSDGKGTIFVNLEDKSETLAIDVTKNIVKQRWPLAPGESPTGLALDFDKRCLFAGCHNEQMMVLDADSGEPLGGIPIGKGVDACAFDPGTGFAFASCGDGTLTVAQENPGKPGEFRVVERINTRQGARTMALDPGTHAVYLATADFETAPTAAPGEKPRRPRMIPGSFVLLKFVR